MARLWFRRELERGLMKRFSDWLVKRLVERGVSPITLTLSAFLLSVAATILYAYHATWRYAAPFAGLTLLASGFLDALDGEVARASSGASRLGAFLDSTLDKVGEALVCIGILFSGLVDGLAILLFCATSLLVGYARARAEGLGVNLEGVGIAERAERVIIASGASLFVPLYPEILNTALYIASALASATVILRIVYAARLLSARHG